MTPNPCPVGPDTLRHLDAEQKRAEKYSAAYTLLRDDFVRTLCDDPAGRIDVPGYGHAVLADIVQDMLDDVDHADRRIRLLRVLALAESGWFDDARSLARTLLAELANAHATDCVETAVGDMSNPD